MNKKKIVAFMLVIAMLALAIAGGTLAYFTDEGEATNVFTVGSVEIELYESTLLRKDNATDAEIIADAANYQTYLAAQELMPGVAVAKAPYVKNTGISDAYVRIRVMIPSALNLDVLATSAMCDEALEEEFSRPAGVAATAFDGTVTVDGVEYNVYSFIRNEPLASGEMTNWNVWNSIQMDTDVLQSEVEALIAAGAITADRQFNVLVQADAIQAASFTNATDAFAAFDAQ